MSREVAFTILILIVSIILCVVGVSFEDPYTIFMTFPALGAAEVLADYE